MARIDGQLSVSNQAIVLQRIRRYDETWLKIFAPVMQQLGELLVREAQGEHLKRRKQGTGQLLNAIGYTIEKGKGRTRGPKGQPFGDVRVGPAAAGVARPVDDYYMVVLGVDQAASVTQDRDPEGKHGLWQEHGTGIYGPLGARYKGRGMNKNRRSVQTQPRTPGGQFASFQRFFVEGHEARPFLGPAIRNKQQAITNLLRLQTNKFANRVEGEG